MNYRAAFVGSPAFNNAADWSVLVNSLGTPESTDRGELTATVVRILRAKFGNDACSIARRQLEEAPDDGGIWREVVAGLEGSSEMPLPLLGPSTAASPD